MKRKNNIIDSKKTLLNNKIELCHKWLNKKNLNELKLTSAGIPELLKLLYDKQKELLPKLGFNSFKEVLELIKYEWEGTEDQSEMVDQLRSLRVPGSQQLMREELLKQNIMDIKKTKRLEEELVRRLVRKYIREGEEDTQPQPEKVEDEPETSSEIADLTDLYIKKLKNSQSVIDPAAVVEFVSQIVDSFGYGNQEKLSILQGVKQEIVR